jgi:predicted DNA-binding protein (MmcQ/YjbR family)
MDRPAAHNYLLSRPESWEDYPFGPEFAVFRIGKLMFAGLHERHGATCINLKCDPEEALILRDVFTAVTPGYHMNKSHWNTVRLDGSIPRGEIERMIDRSYALVVRRLPRADRVSLEVRHGKDALYR